MTGNSTEFKVILVKHSPQQFEELLKKGWRVAQAFPHPQGSLIALAMEKK